MMAVLASWAYSAVGQAPTGFAKPGCAIAVLDLFNLTDDPQYDPWERLLGRGLRRGLHTAKTEKGIAIEIVPQPRLLKAIEDLRIDTHYIPPEQAKPIGERVQSDLVVLGSFNIVEGVVAASLKIVDNHSGLLLHEETRFGSEEKIAEFVVDLSETLNGLLLAGLEGTSPVHSAPPPIVAAPPASPPAPEPTVVAQPTAPESAAGTLEGGILEPVEEAAAEAPQAPATSVPRTQIAGPGGGVPPAPIDDLPMNFPVESVQPAPPPPSAPSAPDRNVQDLLNQTWQNTQGQTVAPQVQTPPPAPVQVEPPYVGEPLSPQGSASAPFTGYAAPPALPPRAPVTVGDPIESRIPPLAPQQQPPPDAVRSPFQPMTPSSAPPPPPAPDQLGYPMVPPNAPNYPPGFPPQQFQQPQPQPGPVGRFFNWVGRGFGLAEDPATPPQMQPGVPLQGQIPQQVGPPVPQQIPQQPQQQQERRPFLWIFDRDR